MHSSVPVRLTLWYLAAAGIVLAAIGGATDAVLRYRLREGLDSSLHSGLRVIAQWLRHEIEEHESKPVGEIWFRSLLATPDQIPLSHSGIAVFEGSRTVAQRRGASGYVPSPAETPLGSEVAPSYVTLRRAGAGYRVAAAAVPVRAAGAVYTVIIGDSFEANQAAVHAFRGLFALIAGGVLLLTGAGGFLLVRKTLAPVLAMSRTVDRLSARELHQRLQVVNPHDELGRLAATFNRLLERLQNSFEQQLRFMADASHELRTPVSIVRTAAEVALEAPEGSVADYREALAVIRGQANRLSRLVHDMLLLARADAGMYPVRKQAFYLDELVHDSAKAARVLAARKAIALRAMAPEEEPCYADEGLLRQLLLILLDNAVKHTPEGGTVSISLRRELSGYLIQVADTGPGIPAHIQPHIFERFYRGDSARTHQDGGGAGLGLSIARWIAGAHRGSLELTSSGPDGTIFSVRMPKETTSVPRLSLSSV